MNRILQIFFTLLLSSIVFSGSYAHADIPEVFQFEICLWEATDIVLATQVSSNIGQLEIQKSWRGDIPVGSKILVPELVKIADEKNRHVYWADSSVPTDPYVKSLSFSKVILFLIDSSSRPNENKQPSEKTEWKSASIFWGLRSSLLWIENGETYAYYREFPFSIIGWKHYGPLVEMEARIEGYCTIRRELDQAIAQKNPIMAAQAVEAFNENRFNGGVNQSLTAIGKMGEISIPALRKLLNNKEYSNLHNRIIDSMVSAGGSTVVPDLMRIVEDEFHFWSGLVPELAEGWLTTPKDRSQLLSIEHEKLLHVLNKLFALKCDNTCQASVTKTLVLWEAIPDPGYSKNGQILRTCRLLINKWSSK